MNGEAPHPSNIVGSIDDFHPDGSGVGHPAELVAGWPKPTAEQIARLRPLWNQTTKGEGPGRRNRGLQHVITRPAKIHGDGRHAA